MFPFIAGSKTFKIDVTSTSASKAIDSCSTIRIINEGYETVFISIGDGLQTATIPTTSAVKTCDPILAGEDIVLSVSQLLVGAGLQIAAICEGSSKLYISMGDGM